MQQHGGIHLLGAPPAVVMREGLIHCVACRRRSPRQHSSLVVRVHHSQTESGLVAHADCALIAYSKEPIGLQRRGQVAVMRKGALVGRVAHQEAVTSTLLLMLGRGEVMQGVWLGVLVLADAAVIIQARETIVAWMVAGKRQWGKNVSPEMVMADGSPLEDGFTLPMSQRRAGIRIVLLVLESNPFMTFMNTNDLRMSSPFYLAPFEKVRHLKVDLRASLVIKATSLS